MSTNAQQFIYLFNCFSFYFNHWALLFYSSYTILPLKPSVVSKQNPCHIKSMYMSFISSVSTAEKLSLCYFSPIGCTSAILTIKAIHSTIKCSLFQTAQLLGNISVHPEWSTKGHTNVWDILECDKCRLIFSCHLFHRIHTAFSVRNNMAIHMFTCKM